MCFLYKNNWFGKFDDVQLPFYKENPTYYINKDIYTLKKEAFDKLVNWAEADSLKIYKDEAGRPIKSIYGDVKWPVAMFVYYAIMNYEQPETIGEDGTAVHKTGWKYFGYLNRFLTKQASSSSKLSMENVMIQSLSEYFDRDFTQLFDRVGISLGNVQTQIALQKEHVEKRIWQSNPMDRGKTIDEFDGKVFQTSAGTGYVPYPHIRSAWQAVAYSDGMKKASNYCWRSTTVSPYALFDGVRDSYWESYYDRYSTYKDEDGNEHQAYYQDSVYFKAKTPQLPYDIVIRPRTDEESDNAVLSKLDGFYYAAGYKIQSSVYGKMDGKGEFTYRPQAIRVYVTTDNLAYEEHDTLFTNIQDIKWTLAYDSRKELESGKQQFWPDRWNTFYVEFDRSYTNVTGIRLEFPEKSHTEPSRPAYLDDLNEDGTPKYPNRPKAPNYELEKIQRFGEFGTYYYKQER